MARKCWQRGAISRQRICGYHVLKMILEGKPHPRRVSYCLGRALDFKDPTAAMLFLEHGADPNFRISMEHNHTQSAQGS